MCDSVAVIRVELGLPGAGLTCRLLELTRTSQHQFANDYKLIKQWKLDIDTLTFSSHIESMNSLQSYFLQYKISILKTTCKP